MVKRVRRRRTVDARMVEVIHCFVIRSLARALGYSYQQDCRELPLCRVVMIGWAYVVEPTTNNVHLIARFWR